MQITKNNIVTALLYVAFTGLIYGGYFGISHYLQSRYNAGFKSGQDRVVAEIIKQANTGKIEIVLNDGKQVVFVPAETRKVNK